MAEMRTSSLHVPAGISTQPKGSWGERGAIAKEGKRTPRIVSLLWSVPSQPVLFECIMFEALIQPDSRGIWETGLFCMSPTTFSESPANACSASSRHRCTLCWRCSLFSGNLRSLLASGSLLELWWAGILHQQSAASAALSVSRAWAGASAGMRSGEHREGKPWCGCVPWNAEGWQRGRLLPAAEESWAEWILNQRAGNCSGWNETQKRPHGPIPKKLTSTLRSTKEPSPAAVSAAFAHPSCSVWTWFFTSRVLKCQNV